MDVFESELVTLLNKKLLVLKMEMVDEMIGHPAIDYAEYKRKFGYIKGIEKALECLKESEIEMTRRPEDKIGATIRTLMGYES